jgi:hypothetical protein
MDITIIIFIHILLLNTLFIFLDHFVVTYFLKAKVSFVIIVAAGLTSLFLGVYLTNLTIQYYFNAQWFGFRNGVVKKSIFLTGALILTLYNILIELPFYIFSSKNKKIGLSLKSAIISNLLTNIPVGLLYLLSDSFYSHPE